MKHFFKGIAFILSAAVVITACRKKNDRHGPPEKDYIPGTYTADLSYQKDASGPAETRNNAIVVVTKSDGKYDFHFPDSVPTLKAAKMARIDGGYSGIIDGYTGNIKVLANHLEITLAKGSERWRVGHEVDPVTGIFSGNITYQQSSPATIVRAKTNVNIVIVKTGDKYDFHFPDDIPDILAVEMTSQAGGYSGSVPGYSGTITITGNRLKVSLTMGDEKWEIDAMQ